MEMNKEEEFDLELKKLEEEIDKRDLLVDLIRVECKQLYDDRAKNDLLIGLIESENEQLKFINKELKQQLDIATDLGEKRFREIERLLILNKELKQQLDAAYEYDFNTF